eukprot:11210705-Lingulodinium_polyedra.AAC.1
MRGHARRRWPFHGGSSPGCHASFSGAAFGCQGVRIRVVGRRPCEEGASGRSARAGEDRQRRPRRQGPSPPQGVRACPVRA